jgi:hypothetical protein
MRLAFGVRRLVFRELGIALGENNWSKNQPSSCHREVAAQSGQRRLADAERQTPNERR